MDNQYLIYCPAGTGGLFLSSVIANFLNIKVVPYFSDTGHCHDLGQGNWKGAEKNINFIGDHWDINFKPDCDIYYVHQGPIAELKTQMPNLKVILIDYDEKDYYNITMLYVYKAWPDIWSEQEYSKWEGIDWPPYSKDNIQTSEIIRNELIKGLTSLIAEWLNNYDSSVVDYSINFNTVLGLNDHNLAEELSVILQQPVTSEITTLIDEYQTLNKRLYFNA